ncbi:hypothetical protein ADM96_35410, partial [Burkholderia sp. ST111]
MQQYGFWYRPGVRGFEVLLDSEDTCACATQCAVENARCSFTGKMTVLYGASTTANNVSKVF